MESEPGIGRIAGERFRSQASATCAWLAPRRSAISASASPPVLRSGKYGTNTIPSRRAVVDDVVVSAVGDVEGVLDRGDRNDVAGALDLRDPDVRNTDVPDLPGLLVLLDRAKALLERRLRIGSMEVVEADGLCLQSAEALRDLDAKHLRSGTVPATFRRNDATLRVGPESSADRVLALPSGVRVGGIDELHAGRDGVPDELDVLGSLREPVRSQPDPDDFGVTEPQPPHCAERMPSRGAGRVNSSHARRH